MVAGGTKVRIPAGARLFFCCSKSPTPAVSPQASYSLDTTLISQRAKRPGPDLDHSAASSTLRISRTLLLLPLQTFKRRSVTMSTEYKQN